MAVQIENLPQMFHGCACAECERDRQRVRDIINALNVAVQKWYDRAHDDDAPDLLATLKSVETYLSSSNYATDCDAELRDVRAAIAKAEA